MYQDIYKIENTENLDSHKCFHTLNTYPKFQIELEQFKIQIQHLVNTNSSKTFYKFGDGDYRFLNQTEIGSAKPGNRALSKPYNQIDLKSHQEGSKKCDYYTCEIYPENIKMFNEIISKTIKYPAEFGYGLVANKWFFETFKGKIGIIGAEPKLKLIEQLLNHTEYQKYLKINKFEDYIYFPQKFAADDLNKLEEYIKPQLAISTSKIFLLGLGHAKSGILHRFTNYKKAIYYDVGAGIDMLAGCINTKRPYAGDWVNYRMSNYNYEGIDYLNYNYGNEYCL